MNRRWWALFAVLSSALLLAPVVLMVVPRPVAAPSGSALASASGTASASLTPTASAEAAAWFTEAASPEDAAWYRIGGDQRLLPQHLRIGTVADGVTFDEEIPGDPTVAPEGIVPMRPVLGVGDGVVVVVLDDGERSTMRAVVAATGDAHDLLVSRDVIRTGLLAPDGRIAYFVTADRLTGELSGAWQLDVRAGHQPRSIDALMGEAPGFRLAAVTRLFSRMLLSPDGSMLGLFRCLELDCELRVIRTGDGALVAELAIPRGGTDPFAITDTTAVLRPVAMDGPHAVGEVIDLATGMSAEIPFDGLAFGSVALTHGTDGALMAVQTAGFSAPPEAMNQPPEPPEVTIIDVADMAIVTKHAPELSSLAILDADDPSVGVDLPPGWILIRGTIEGEVTMSMYAMNAEDGGLVPLPGMGELVPRG